MARILVGPDHKALLPASAALGALFLLLIDDVARAATPAEIPLGIITAIIGAPGSSPSCCGGAMPGAGAVIDVEGAGVTLGGKWIFRALSFSVARGETLAILGRNGKGKTTLLRALLGSNAR